MPKKIKEFLDKIICGDCLEVMSEIPDESVHLAITSPPYNVGVGYDKHDDSMNYEQYLDWLTEVWRELKRILVVGGRFCLNIAPTGISPFIPVHYDLAERLLGEGFILRTEILWYKQTIRKRTAWGSWKSPSNPHILPSWEYILIFSKGQWNLEGAVEKIDINASEFEKFSDGFWYIPPENFRRGHPAPFPKELIDRLVKYYSYKENVVLDMFGGTGTVAVVSAVTGRNFIHIDISEEYCKVARTRLAKELRIPISSSINDLKLWEVGKDEGKDE